MIDYDPVLAVKVLFGTESTEQFRERGSLGSRVFSSLLKGEHHGLLLLITTHHHWIDHDEDGLTIQVYPGEWLIVESPVDHQVRASFPITEGPSK